MRYSKQREQVLKIVKGTNRHPTADWIYRKMREIFPSISLGTVYRNLGQLVGGNLIRSQTVNGIVHYDGNLEDHQHFYCTRCSGLYDLDLPVQEFVSEVASRIEHNVQAYDLQLRGVCASCRADE